MLNTATSSTTYVPNRYLVASSPLTAAELTSQYEDFLQNVQHITTAPQLVFERIFGNINVAYKSAIEQTPQELAANLKSCKAQLETLQQTNDQLRAELSQLKATTSHLVEPQALQTLQQSNDQLRVELAQLRAATIQVNEPRRLDLAIGSVHTDEVRPRNIPQLKTSKEVTFAIPYSETPSGLLTGITDLDISNIDHIRVNSHCSNLRRDGFTINLDSWEVPNSYGLRCMWLGVAAGSDPDIHFGTVAWDETWTQAKESVTRQVFFQHVYPFPPVVVVWLCAFAMDRTKNWRIKTYASQVTTNGFTLHMDTWADSLVYGIQSAWLAYSADKPRTLSGSINTQNVRPSFPPRQSTSGNVSFGNTFRTTPRIFAALNYLDMDCGRNLRLYMRQTAGVTGMDWSFNTWGDSILYAAGASYIAMV